jgi:transcriptional regulator with XRE-family HTH domain
MAVEQQVARGVTSRTTGERIRIKREARGMSRPVLAGLVGRSSDWLKKIENGDRQLNSLPLLIQLARTLGVDDLSELTGDDFNAPTHAWQKDVHHVVPAIRLAMQDASFGPPPSDTATPALDADNLDRQVTQLWLLWHRSPMQRSEVGVALPRLIRQAHSAIRSTEGSARRQCRSATADLYRLVQRLLAHICEPELQRWPSSGAARCRRTRIPRCHWHRRHGPLRSACAPRDITTSPHSSPIAAPLPF